MGIDKFVWNEFGQRALALPGGRKPWTVCVSPNGVGLIPS